MWVLLYLIPCSIIALALAKWWRTNLLYGGIKYQAIKPWSKNCLRSGYLWYGLTVLLSSPFILALDLAPPMLVELNFLGGVFIMLLVLLPPTFLFLGVSSEATGDLRFVLLKAQPLLKSLSALNPWVVRDQDWDNIRSHEEHAWFPHVIELTGFCPIIVMDIRASSTQLRRELAFVLRQPNAQKTIFLGHSSDPYTNRLMERVERRRRAYNEAELVWMIRMITNSREDLLSFYQTPIYKTNSQLDQETRLPVSENEEHYWAELLWSIHIEMMEIFSFTIASAYRIEQATTGGKKIYRYENANLDRFPLPSQITSNVETKVQEVINSFKEDSLDNEATARTKLAALSIETIVESIHFWRMKRLEQIRELCPICGELYTLKAGYCLNNIRERVELLMRKRDPETAEILLELLDESVKIARISPAVKNARERYLSYSIRCHSHSEFEPDLEIEREIAHAQSHLIQPGLQAEMLVTTLQQTLNAIGNRTHPANA